MTAILFTQMFYSWIIGGMVLTIIWVTEKEGHRWPYWANWSWSPPLTFRDKFDQEWPLANIMHPEPPEEIRSPDYVSPPERPIVIKSDLEAFLLDYVRDHPSTSTEECSMKTTWHLQYRALDTPIWVDSHMLGKSFDNECEALTALAGIKATILEHLDYRVSKEV